MAHAYDLTTLEMFVQVCETASIASAAERSNVVTSAVSKRMTQLEGLLGVQVLARKRHGMVPTVAGQMLLEHARTVLHAAERLDHDLRAHALGGWGQVRVLASVSSMMGPLVPDITSFLQAHTQIRVDLEEAITPRVVDGVRGGMAALGISWTAADLSDLHTVPYRSDELCVVVPHGHPLCRKKRLKFEEVLEHDVVAQPPTSSLQILMRQLAAKAGTTLQQRVIAHSYDTMLRVVHAGLAISIVPRAIAHLSGNALGLRQIALDEPWAIRQFVICYRGEAALTSAASRLLEHLQEVSAQ